MVTELDTQTILERLQALEKANAAKDAELASLRQAQDEQVNGGGDDSLRRAHREFVQANSRDMGGVMSGPCLVCGQTWLDEDENVRPIHKKHTFRSYVPKPASIHGDYRRDKSREVEPLDPSQIYMDIPEAAKALSATQAQVKKLIRSGELKSTSFGKVLLIHRTSVNSLLEAAGLKALGGGLDTRQDD